MKEPNDLISTEEAANYLHLSPATLATWRSSKRYNLPYVKIGKKVFYKRSVIDKWLENRVF